MSPKRACVWAVVLAGFAAAPLSAGQRAALVLQGDLGPQLRLSQAAQEGPAVAPRRLDSARPAVPAAPSPWIEDHRPLAELLSAPPLEQMPAPDRLVVTAQFGGQGEAASGPGQASFGALLNGEADALRLASFTQDQGPYQAPSSPTAEDLADPLTRLLGEQPDEYIRPIGELTADIAFKPGPLPERWDRMATERFARAGEVVAAFGSDRPWPPFTYAYVAPGLCHRPLYFEEPNVERYGYQLGCVQPVVSGAHFFATVPFLPYKMVLRRPHDCTYTLGQYRPGDYTPFQRTRFVWNTPAAVAEAGVIVGLVFIIP